MEIKGEITVGKTPRYRWIYRKVDEKKILDLFFKFSHLPKFIIEILIKRGLDDKESINEFFEAPLSNLHNPFLMKGMDRAVNRILNALRNNEKICIYGDYDVDGVTATSLLYDFFSQVTTKVEFYIPKRLEEGYSLNIDAINELKSRDVSLIITVDCGITSVDEVKYAKENGIDVIITDHHQLSDQYPKDAYSVLNPIQNDDNYPFKHLSGVGVAFKLLMALKYSYEKEFKKNTSPLKSYLDLVALGTIADVVPLIGENRILVKHGLKLIENSPRFGIEELKKISGLTKSDITSSNIGFTLAPRINAVGRLGNCKSSVKLLITKNQNEAKWLSEELETENKYRQEIEKNILRDTIEKIEKKRINLKYKGIVIYSTDWHPGLIGIIASRLVEKYSKPSIVLTIENDIAKGSARSIQNFDIFECLQSMSDILIEFGGHRYATGLKLPIKNIPILQKRFHDYISKYLTDEQLIPELSIDAYIEPLEINDHLFDLINRFRPFGNGNPEPIFCMKKVRKAQEFALMGKERSILKGFIEKRGKYFEIIGFNMSEYRDIIDKNEYFDIVFTPEYNKWLGGTNILLKLKDIKQSS
ncbi:MAG: single-stranded-DNA-specific exonuclease RecJ [Deferribacterales bacterium]